MFGRIAISLLVACSAPPAKPAEVPPPSKPLAPAMKPASDPTVVRRVKTPIALEILGVDVDGANGINQRATRAAQTLTEQLRAAAREDRLIHMGGQTKQLVDEKLMAGCETEATDCMVKIATNLGADHLIYGGIEEAGGTFHVHLKLLEVTSKIVIAWTGDTDGSDADLVRTAKTAFDSLISRSP